MNKKQKIIMSLLLVIAIVVGIAILVYYSNKIENNIIETTDEDVAVQTENPDEDFTTSTEEEKYTAVLDDDSTKLNISEKLNEEKEIDEFLFQNIQLTFQDEQTILLADVTNTGETKEELTFVEVTLLDEEGKKIVTVAGTIEPLNTGEQTQFVVSMTIDYANAYDFEIKIK